MAASFPGGDGSGGDKTQAIPKMLLVVLIVGVVIVAVVAGVVLTHNHGGTSAGQVAQPADPAAGPQLGSEGAAQGRSPAAGVSATAGQGGAPAGPSAGAPGTAP